MARLGSWLALLALLLCGLFLWLREAPQAGPAPIAEEAPPPAPERVGIGAVGASQQQSSEPSPAALQAAPERDAWILKNNQGAQHLEDGDLLAALESFESCVAARPLHEVFRANLGECLVRLALHDYAQRAPEQAMLRLQRALTYRPGQAPLVALLARWRAEAEAELDHWSESSDLLELSYDVKRPDLLDSSRQVMDHLERAYGDLQLWFGVDPVRDLGVQKIRVVLYGEQEFESLTGLGDWASGVFDGVVRIAAGKRLPEQASWRRTMTHELVHAYVHALGGNSVPGWLNEGLAQLLESDQPDLDEARRRLGKRRFELAQLKHSLATWSDTQAISQAYAQSLLFVELIRREHGEEVLRRMLIGCKSGLDPAQSFEQYTAVPLESLLEFLR